MRLTRAQGHILSVTILALVVSFTISLVGGLVNYGFAAGFTPRWLRAWALVFLIAWPTLFFVMPALTRIVGRLTRR